MLPPRRRLELVQCQIGILPQRTHHAEEPVPERGLIGGIGHARAGAAAVLSSPTDERAEVEVLRRPGPPPLLQESGVLGPDPARAPRHGAVDRLLVHLRRGFILTREREIRGKNEGLG